MHDVTTTKSEAIQEFAAFVHRYKTDDGKVGIEACVPRNVAAAMFVTPGRGWREITYFNTSYNGYFQLSEQEITPNEDFLIALGSSDQKAEFEAEVPDEVAKRMLAHAKKAGIEIWG
jgi:hypothetical protein